MACGLAARLHLWRDERLCDGFMFDEMARLAMIRIDGLQDDDWHAITDNDVTFIAEYLQRGGLRVGNRVVEEAVNAHASARAFHPVRDYLDGLAWDRVPRLDTWTTTYLSTEDSAYTTAIGRMFLIAMVARIYRPG
jgi:predicted P-loop ATPase